MGWKPDENEPPDEAAIRAALGRVIASNTFAASPRLVSFLRFVVEATLSGRGESLKGYTVGVEALGRPESFDPQVDPIVRVEAGRLRAALARYHATSGRNDPIVIELPRGAYVPTFRRRNLPLGLRKYAFSGRRAVFRRALRRSRLLAQVASIAAAAALLGNVALATWLWMSPPEVTASVRLSADLARPPPVHAAFPLVFIEPFETSDQAAAAAKAVGKLRNGLRDALARFDEIDLTSDANWDSSQDSTPNRPIARSAYRIAANADGGADGAFTLSVRVSDANDGTVVWTHVLDNLRVGGGSLAGEREIVHRLATTIAQPYGVIYARELARSATGAGDPRYLCVIEAFEFYRTHDPARRTRTRACVERITRSDPTFAAGQVALAFVMLLDYFDNSNDITALEVAMAAAHRAVSLDPESARAHQVMMIVLYARGDAANALAVGKKAVALNPYDMIVLTSYGIRLLWSAEADQAMAMLREAAEYGPGQPQFVYFALFMGAYTRGDDAEAARYANLLASDTYAYGLAARAIVARRSGRPELAQRAIHNLVQLNPGWRKNAKVEIERYGVPPAVAARMASDLDAAGIRADN